MSTIWNAETYDSPRRRLVPRFDDFYGSAATVIARTAPTATPRILDLGAGTGLLSQVVKEQIPGASLMLLDASSAMLEQARVRLEGVDAGDGGGAAKFIVGDLLDDFPIDGAFDVVMSSLAIHHLPTERKRSLFSRVHETLRPGGVFVNAEQIQGNNESLQRLNEFMHMHESRRLGSDANEIREACQRMDFDRCETLQDQVQWMDECGFSSPSVIYTWFRFAVFAAWKAPGPIFLNSPDTREVSINA